MRSKFISLENLTRFRDWINVAFEALQEALAPVATSGSYNDLDDKPTIPTVNNATLTIQKNGSSVGTFTANASNNETVNIVVPVSAADVSALPSSTKYGNSITVSMNSSTYVMTVQLNDQDGNALGTAQTVDLPLESMVVGGSYNDATKKVVLTLKSGDTVEFSVADLVSGLQSEITSANKLSADLIQDGNTNKAFTSTEKTKLSNIEAGAQVNVQSDWNAVSGDAMILNKPTIPTVPAMSTVAMQVTFMDQTTATYNVYYQPSS